MKKISASLNVPKRTFVARYIYVIARAATDESSV